jgi:hypothetical protein
VGGVRDIQVGEGFTQKHSVTPPSPILPKVDDKVKGMQRLKLKLSNTQTLVEAFESSNQDFISSSYMLRICMMNEQNLLFPVR